MKKNQKNKKILAILDAEEQKVRQTLVDDADDFEELKSDWQERDSPSENNLRSVEWNQYASLQDALVEIEAAKARLENDAYGICELCEHEIGEKRLEALPTARHCIACQQQFEAESGMEKRASL